MRHAEEEETRQAPRLKGWAESNAQRRVLVHLQRIEEFGSMEKTPSMDWVRVWGESRDDFKGARAFATLRRFKPATDDVAAMHHLFLGVLCKRSLSDTWNDLSELWRSTAPRTVRSDGHPQAERSTVGQSDRLHLYFGVLRNWLRGQWGISLADEPKKESEAQTPEPATSATATAELSKEPDETEPDVDSVSGKRERVRRERRARALLILQEHPDWSDARIARELKVSASTLSRDDLYRRLSKVARQLGYEPTRGRVDVDADTKDRKVVAVDDSEDSNEDEDEQA